MEAQAFSSREAGTLQKQHRASCGKYRRKLLSSFTIRAARDMLPVDILLSPGMACGVMSKACLESRWLFYMASLDMGNILGLLADHSFHTLALLLG